MQAKDIGAGPYRQRRDFLAQSQAVEHVHGIGAELDARPDLHQLVGLLENADIVAGLHQAQRGGHATDTGAGNQDSLSHPDLPVRHAALLSGVLPMHRLHRHSALSQSRAASCKLYAQEGVLAAGRYKLSSLLALLEKIRSLASAGSPRLRTATMVSGIGASGASVANTTAEEVQRGFEPAASPEHGRVAVEQRGILRTRSAKLPRLPPPLLISA